MYKAKFTIDGSCVLGFIEDSDSVVLTIELEKDDFDPDHVLNDVLVAYRSQLDWLLDRATAGWRVWSRLASALHLIDVVEDIIATGSYDVVTR